MNWTALLYTVLLCLISIIIEGVSATKDGKQWFESLKQPKYSFPFSFWYVVGGLYYLICGVIAYRQFANSGVTFSLPIIILTIIMIFNGATNFILFRHKSLKAFYLVLYPFAALFAVLVYLLAQQDILSAGLSAIYLAWLVYDIYYFHSLWQLNS
jgi:tryptophan-rich sensory protein